MPSRSLWNPRHYLSAAVGWSVFTVLVLAALIAADLAATESEQRARADAQNLLSEFAVPSRQMLIARLETRHLLVQATAAQIVASSDRGAAALRRHLEALREQFPEFAWLGVADEQGFVVAGTEAWMQGDNVSALPWFIQGRSQSWVNPEPKRVPLRKGATSADAGTAARVIEIAVPLSRAEGRTVGVVGAYLSWSWIARLQQDMLSVLGAQRKLELLLTAQDGTVLVGPDHWLGRKLASDSDLSESGAYLVGQAAEGHASDGNLLWSETVRQPTRTALAPAASTQRAVFLVVLSAGLLAALAAVYVTRVLMRRLSRLASDAEAVQRGTALTLKRPDGDDEVSLIGATLAEVVGHLQSEKQHLITLNTQLDARVAERTARIERLADESRHAAVTRERLRLARDLHDTLAHSLMALLTQLRLIRKLGPQLDVKALDDELARAEDVAASGVVEARAAITQMRKSSVRDTGLGAALKELLGHFAERTGVAISVEADAAGSTLADGRAETVFRIVEQALRNIEHHAQARHVALTLQAQPSATPANPDAGGEAPQSLCVTVADDGVGFDPALPRGAHFGLQGMREQAALIGAEFIIDSHPGKGTRVVIAFEL